MKKISLFLINYIFLSFLFAFLNNQIKWGIHNYKITHGSLIFEYFNPIIDLIGGFAIALLIYLLYFAWAKMVKRKNVLKSTLIFAILVYVILSLIVALLSGWITMPIFLLRVTPIFVISLVLPFSEWLFAKMIKYKFKGS